MGDKKLGYPTTPPSLNKDLAEQMARVATIQKAVATRKATYDAKKAK